MGRRIFITVAEVSGDKHAAQLIRSLRELDPQLTIEGHGGPEMAEAGARIHRNTVARATMGWRAALLALDVYKLLRWTNRYFDEYQPDLQIGVDSPSMNFHFARLARRRGIPALQYVAPQLWAWAPWRMKKLRDCVDQVACILPFEESYFRAHGVNATFVGHPLFDELPSGRGLGRTASSNGRPPVIGLLPGSRKAEAQHNFPPMLAVADRLRREFRGVQFLVPTTDATDPIVQKLMVGQPSDIEFALDAFDQMVPRCDLCITVSGTATLHVASFGVPMIVVYRVSPLTWHAGGRWLVKARTFALVNLLAKQATADAVAEAGGHIVPEYVPWIGPTDEVAELAIKLLRNPDQLQAQREQLDRLVRTLDHPGASMRVARMALEMIGSKATQSIH